MAKLGKPLNLTNKQLDELAEITEEDVERVNEKWAKAVLIGWSIGFVACVLGLGSSYFFNFPYGPTLVLFLGVFFVCAMVLRCLLSRTNVNY